MEYEVIVQTTNEINDTLRSYVREGWKPTQVSTAATDSNEIRLGVLFVTVLLEREKPYVEGG